MELLRVVDNQIVSPSGQPVRLRGFNIGGWLNLEDFIDGFVGAEYNLRATMSRIIGKEKAQVFFDRLIDPVILRLKNPSRSRRAWRLRRGPDSGRTR